MLPRIVKLYPLPEKDAVSNSKGSLRVDKRSIGQLPSPKQPLEFQKRGNDRPTKEPLYLRVDKRSIGQLPSPKQPLEFQERGNDRPTRQPLYLPPGAFVPYRSYFIMDPDVLGYIQEIKRMLKKIKDEGKQTKRV